MCNKVSNIFTTFVLMKNIDEILSEAGIRPTSNRVIVLREILNSPNPLSLGELEGQIDTLEKSSILRVLTQLSDHHLVHSVEDGRGVIKYETCHGRHEHGVDTDMHVHFYCEKCKRVVCFEDIPVPQIPLPDGFVPRSVNYMLKGLCPDCSIGKNGY